MIRVSDKKVGLQNKRETRTVKRNECLLHHRRRFLSHAGTSIAQNGASSKRKLIPNGTTDSRSRAAGHARGIKASDQAMGKAASHVSPLWGKAAPTGRNDAPGDRHDVRTRGGATPALSLSRVWASLVPS